MIRREESVLDKHCQSIIMFTKIIFGVLLVDLAYGNSLSRIIGGSDTDTKKHGHQVSLRFNGGHICGGSIIGANWVLTAAHCVDSNSISSYTIGVNDGTLNDPNGKSFSISKIIPHESYLAGSGGYPNDVALLKLSSDIIGNKDIGLASAGENFDGQTCTITGWGYTDGSNVAPNQLQETTGTIMTHQECRNWWRTNYNGDVHICIANPSTGSCNGDSGGPMVCSNKLVGVTSWGYSGCSTNYPSVYARVSTFNEWIYETMSNN